MKYTNLQNIDIEKCGIAMDVHIYQNNHKIIVPNCSLSKFPAKESTVGVGGFLNGLIDGAVKLHGFLHRNTKYTILLSGVCFLWYTTVE